MIRRIAHHPTVRQFTRFALIGFFNTAVDWVIFFALTSWVGWFGHHILVANTISFITAFANSYYLNRTWTFRSQNPKYVQQFTRFLGVNLIGLGINLTVLWVVFGATQSRLIGKTAAVAVSLFWNFFAGKAFAFRE